MLRTVQLSDIFDIKSGDYHALKDLDEGNIPLISCGETDSGFVGYYNIPEEKTYSNRITVAYNGSWPLLSKFHPYRFGAKDDVAVLSPRSPLRIKTLLYVAALLTLQTWRYSYGRKCYQNKIGKVEILLPYRDDGQLDEDYIEGLTAKNIEDYIPENNGRLEEPPQDVVWDEKPLTDFFDIMTGDFHRIEDLDNGSIPLISCADTDEGITGYYDIDTSKTYENTLTVTYDGLPLTAKYHDYRFAAYDNVGVLVPRHDYRKTTLVYMAAAITSKRWRYSYGRKCYKSKLTNLKIVVPVTGNNVINEDVIEQLVKSTAYSSFVLT
jgi:hypothetical protein